ncbi:hypothetical protein ACMA5I_05350 [Paracoccaceae bacterium GXU_MW_L88]
MVRSWVFMAALLVSAPAFSWDLEQSDGVARTMTATGPFDLTLSCKRGQGEYLDLFLGDRERRGVSGG